MFGNAEIYEWKYEKNISLYHILYYSLFSMKKNLQNYLSIVKIIVTRNFVKLVIMKDKKGAKW